MKTHVHMPQQTRHAAGNGIANLLVPLYGVAEGMTIVASPTPPDFSSTPYQMGTVPLRQA